MGSRSGRVAAVALVALLLATIAAPLFAQTSPSYCVVRFQHDVRGRNVWQGGTAYIDFGVGNLKTVQYESMAALLNEMSGWGWELVTGFPLLENRISMLVFRKR
jgi:hypothetical protein